MSHRDCFFTITGYLLICFLAAGIFLLGKFSNLLRDRINNPSMFLKNSRHISRYAGLVDIASKRKKIPRPYSLSKTQLALWVLVICGTYVYLRFCIADPQAIIPDTNTLAMLGISVGTTAGGVVIDKSQDGVIRYQNRPSHGFFYDILSDENGVSITRFQQVMWTFISVILYLSQVPHLKPGHLPTFDAAILSLTGFSNAAYLALKAGENTGNTLKAINTNNLLEGDTPQAGQTLANGIPKPGALSQPR